MSDNCGHLGLVLGRNDSMVYSYLLFNNLGAITLHDSDGNTYWQVSSSEINIEQGNLLKFKTLDEATDMIISTSS